MLTPTLNVIGVILAFTIAGVLYRVSPAEPGRHFYLPIFFLILYYTLATVLTNHRSYSVRPIWTATKKAIGKYVFWFALIGGLYLFYGKHPFYVEFAPHTRQMLGDYLWIFAIGGLPYLFYVEWRRCSRFEMLNDSYLRFVSFLRTVGRLDGRRIRYRLLHRGYKSLLLSWIIRVHYIPVMVEQVYYGVSRVSGILASPTYNYTVESTAAFLVFALFCLDSTNASIGYFWESSLTGTRFRETDPNPFHWIVVLVCYYPFREFAGNFFPFPHGVEGSALVIDHPGFRVVANVCTILALGGMVFVTTSLGFSYSNLSYKKIQTNGLYRIVRHPGTVCKLLFFFFSIFRYQSSFCFATITLYGIWSTIYLTRAVCEERFLKQFPEYRRYMARVRYRFIPGVC